MRTPPSGDGMGMDGGGEGNDLASTSLCVNSRILMGCTDPPPLTVCILFLSLCTQIYIFNSSVSSRFDSKLHVPLPLHADVRQSDES